MQCSHIVTLGAKRDCGCPDDKPLTIKCNRESRWLLCYCCKENKFSCDEHLSQLLDKDGAEVRYIGEQNVT
jgi:hypothetical protein